MSTLLYALAEPGMIHTAQHDVFYHLMDGYPGDHSCESRLLLSILLIYVRLSFSSLS